MEAWKKALGRAALKQPPLEAAVGTSINTTRKATVAYPTVKRLLLHMFYATHPQKLLESHEMV